jgi:hypothetical protein
MVGKHRRIMVYIRKDQKEWLKTVPAISLTGLVRQILREERRKTKPFNYHIRIKRKGSSPTVTRSIGVYVPLSLEELQWLSSVKTTYQSKRILSTYLQYRIDYIRKTGIVTLTVSFQKTINPRKEKKSKFGSNTG